MLAHDHSPDDIKWCVDNISSEDVFFTKDTFKPNYQILFDFVALQHCNNSIVSSGTFGLWSAYMKSTGIHIYNGYMRNGQIDRGFIEYLKTPTTTWIKMDDPCRYMLDDRWAMHNSSDCIGFR
jgi:hypothetical protein